MAWYAACCAVLLPVAVAVADVAVYFLILRPSTPRQVTTRKHYSPVSSEHRGMAMRLQGT